MLALLFRFLLGSVFVASGFNKLRLPISHFAEAIETYHLVGPDISFWMAALIPWFELVAGIFLILGLYTKQSARVIFVMLIVFISALASALIRKLDLSDCGCFGEGVHLAPSVTLLIDLCLLIMSASLSFKAKISYSLDEWFDSR